MKAFCSLNPLWLRKVTDSWAVVRSFEARVIAIRDDWESRDGGVLRGKMLLVGPAPLPYWESRGKYLHRKLLHRSFDPHVVPTIDVGLDVVYDLEWIKTGGINQNLVVGGDGEPLDYTQLYGMPNTYNYETTSDEDGSDKSEGGEMDVSISSYNRRMMASARLELKCKRAVYHGNRDERSSSASISRLANRILTRLDSASKELFNVSLNELPPAPASPDAEGEKHDSDLSLDASNNLSMDSLKRYVFFLHSLLVFLFSFDLSAFLCFSEDLGGRSAGKKRKSPPAPCNTLTSTQELPEVSPTLVMTLVDHDNSPETSPIRRPAPSSFSAQNLCPAPVGPLVRPPAPVGTLVRPPAPCSQDFEIGGVSFCSFLSKFSVSVFS